MRLTLEPNRRSSTSMMARSAWFGTLPFDDAHDEVVMYWYEVDRGKGGPRFKAHRIVAGIGTGIGTQFQIHDVNGDSKPDIVLSNKKGVNVLMQK